MLMLDSDVIWEVSGIKYQVSLVGGFCFGRRNSAIGRSSQSPVLSNTQGPRLIMEGIIAPFAMQRINKIKKQYGTEKVAADDRVGIF